MEGTQKCLSPAEYLRVGECVYSSVSVNTSVPFLRFILRRTQSTKRTRHTDQHSDDLHSGPIERHAARCAEWHRAIAPEQKSRRAEQRERKRERGREADRAYGADNRRLMAHHVTSSFSPTARRLPARQRQASAASQRPMSAGSCRRSEARVAAPSAAAR